MLAHFLAAALLLHTAGEALPLSEGVDPPSPLSTYPPTRSVYNIVWSCFLTTFLCAWVSIHPPVPSVEGGSWEKAGRKIFLFVQLIIAPEFGVAWAAERRRAARKIKSDAREKGFKITTTHAHFLNMGGFALCYPERKVREVLRIDRSETDEKLVKLRFIETLTPERFMELLEAGAVELAMISKGELRDRSKADSLAKLITALQVLWFVVQCIVRRIQRLDMTQLEVTTLALASLNSYLLWLSRDRPQDVGISVPMYLLEESNEWENVRSGQWEQHKANWIQQSSLESATEGRRREAEEKMPKWRKFLLSPWNFLVRLVRCVFTLEYLQRFYAGFQSKSPTRQPIPAIPRDVAIHAAIVGTLFGALHFAGWNLSFPSVTKFLWHFLSLSLTISPIFFPLWSVIPHRPALKTVVHFIGMTSFVVFLLSRNFIIILSLVLLRYQPATAYLAISWTRLFPHLSS